MGNKTKLSIICIFMITRKQHNIVIYYFSSNIFDGRHGIKTCLFELEAPWAWIFVSLEVKIAITIYQPFFFFNSFAVVTLLVSMSWWLPLIILLILLLILLVTWMVLVVVWKSVHLLMLMQNWQWWTEHLIQEHPTHLICPTLEDYKLFRREEAVAGHCSCIVMYDRCVYTSICLSPVMSFL